MVRGLTQAHEPRIVDDIKRVKICGPKPGNLYPDLTGIDETTDSETEFTVGSTEPETATLEEPTETETEADYYVEVCKNLVFSTPFSFLKFDLLFVKK